MICLVLTLAEQVSGGYIWERGAYNYGRALIEKDDRHDLAEGAIVDR